MTSYWPPAGLYAELYRTQFERQLPARDMQESGV